jgi:L-ascorbate metabolism protein UlaG (beta-lactamase superfamily)
MQLTYYGHSCFSVQVDDKTILFDPFITGNPRAGDIDIQSISADFIFISHAHFDHMLDVKVIAQNTGAKVVAGWELYNWLNKQGTTNTQPLNPGGKWEFDFGTVKCTIAQHSSSLPDGSYGGSAAGYAFYTKAGNFYYSGDTALTLDMKLLAKGLLLDFLVLPIGDALTMGTEDAIELTKWLDVKTVVGVHFDTFEFIKIDHQFTQKSFGDAGVKLHLIDIGNTINIRCALKEPG